MDEARAVALVDRQAAARQSVVDRLVAALTRLWRQLAVDDRYSDAAVAAFSARAADLSRAAQVAAAGAAAAYLRQMLVELGVESGRSRGAVPASPRVGVDPRIVYERPVQEYRRLRADGWDALEADARALQRLELIGDTDVALAVRDASRQVLVAADRVTGWRRVVHPELAAGGGSCGLCVAASTRVYRRDDLMPLHSRCACTVAPVVRGEDVGGAVNAAALRALYASAGTSAAADLARTRWAVREHGELGPVLVAAGHAFRGPSEVADTVA